MPALLKAGLLGGLVLFGWGIISWMVMPYHSAVVHHFPNETVVMATLREYTPEAGVYAIPGHFETLKSNQPFALLSVRPNGFSATKAQRLAIGLLGNIVMASLAAYLISIANIRRYGRRVAMCTVLGALIALASYFSLWNGWGFGLDFVLAFMIDSLIGWVLAGSIISRFVGG